MDIEGQRCVLIVDDEPELRNILEEVIKDLCYYPLLAKGGKEALEILKTNPEISTVLSDVAMPDMTGIELLREVRRFGMNTPFIFLTAFGSKEDMKEALQLGGFDFIDKPFKVNNLTEVLIKAVELGNKQKQIAQHLEDINALSPEASEAIKALKKKGKQLSLLKVANNLQQKKRS